MHYRKNFYRIRSDGYIMEKLEKEVAEVGYYALPFAEVAPVLDFAKGVKQPYIVVLGIGGSSLGSAAIYEFLKRKYDFEKTLLFLESTDPIDIKSKLDTVKLEETLFLVISKSGTTVETMGILKYLSVRTVLDGHNTVVISGKGTVLEQFAQKQRMPFFALADNVGGRFSVFSVAGLVPLAILGVDIGNMLKGAQKIHRSFFDREKSYEMLMEKARFIVENKNRFNINVLFSYSSALEYFNKWYIQLWAESLGKVNINGTRQGLTPIGLVGPVDQHSFLQLIMEGTRDKTVTFVKVNDFEEQIIIPSGTMVEALPYLEGISFSKLIDLQADATIEAIAAEGDIPYDVITIDRVDEYNIAELMYSYELLVSIIGAFLQINAYDQPGVEHGKEILKKMLEAKDLHD